jgi:hypothetical protein
VLKNLTMNIFFRKDKRLISGQQKVLKFLSIPY